ncbi:FMN-binding protein [Robiginitalea sp. IMCC43444]|uniref:FMN-binding protein n=1 Tax=Robiginitalea sp. IMCC43444 TaxID=3459121 RepID=UPI0040433A42
MFKLNSILYRYGAMVIMALLLSGYTTNSISPRLQQKLQAAVESTFSEAEFDLLPISINPNLAKKASVPLGEENLFKISREEELLGYAYLGNAPSMKNTFDYVVLFTPDMSIKKAKVLIYREDYGRQIGSQRWLKQFIGKKAGESVSYGKDVDAISGATISARSMTLAVDKVLVSMAMLKAEKAL